MSFVIPVDRLRDTNTLVAFHHPQPSHEFHILIVPKRALANFMQLNNDDRELLMDVVETVQSLVLEYGLQNSAYRLISNGGEYQEVEQLHFHLIADKVDL